MKIMFKYSEDGEGMAQAFADYLRQHEQTTTAASQDIHQAYQQPVNQMAAVAQQVYLQEATRVATLFQQKTQDFAQMLRNLEYEVDDANW